MKHCPLCEKSYGDDIEVCELDGAKLADLSPKQDLLIGKTIKDRYRVVEKLGEGGMGTVYLAEQLNMQRKAALKVLHERYARDDEFVQRFRHEARLAASLNHHNVVTIYDFDQAEDGSLFIAMEYVRGKRLSELIRQESRLGLASAIRLGIQISEGLEAAHRAGIIHRDIKPDNILVVGDRADEVKLMDFGIARLKSTEIATRLTRPGMVVGTPEYMAPEQIQGGEITERTDIYAFGIVLYEMLTGNVPFSASTPSAVLIKHLSEAPVPLVKLRKAIPAIVEQVVTQALEKKPEKRQRNVAEVGDALRKALATLEAEQVPKTMVAPAATLISKEMASLVKNKQEPVPSTIVATQPVEVVKISERGRPNWDRIGMAAFALFLVAGVIAAIYLYRLPSGEISAPLPAPVTKAPESPSPPPPAQLVSLRVLTDKKELHVKEHVALKVQGEYSDGNVLNVAEGLQWQSSDPTIAQVDPRGEVLGIREGRAEITVSYSGLRASPVTLVVKTGVLEKPALAPELESLALYAPKRELETKERVTLSAKGKYSDGKETQVSKGVQWQSSNESIAVVNPRGEVRGQAEGQVQITARYRGVASPPLSLTVKGGIKSPEPEKRKPDGVESYLKTANAHRERGEYEEALAQLEKAKGIDPSNKDVLKLIEVTRRACEAEKRLGRSELRCGTAF
ncbi:MAG: protein kinase [Deltaproteobacteria bacterium]|nr:protein kinase [Deltaproteobacteria bacterium]